MEKVGEGEDGGAKASGTNTRFERKRQCRFNVESSDDDADQGIARRLHAL